MAVRPYIVSTLCRPVNSGQVSITEFRAVVRDKREDDQGSAPSGRSGHRKLKRLRRVFVLEDASLCQGIGVQAPCSEVLELSVGIEYLLNGWLHTTPTETCVQVCYKTVMASMTTVIST